MKLLEKVKVPIDVILIVVAPFVGFLVLFMYLAGLIPAQPIVVEIPENATVRQLGEERAGETIETAVAQAPPTAVQETVTPAVEPEVESVPEKEESGRLQRVRAMETALTRISFEDVECLAAATSSFSWAPPLPGYA